MYTDLWKAIGFKIKKDNFSIFLNHYSIAALRVIILKSFRFRDFPGSSVVKNPPANAGDMVSIPGPGRSHMPRSN